MLRDRAILAIAEAHRHPPLQQLDLSGLNNITEVAVSWLSERCHSISLLNVTVNFIIYMFYKILRCRTAILNVRHLLRYRIVGNIVLFEMMIIFLACFPSPEAKIDYLLISTVLVGKEPRIFRYFNIRKFCDPRTVLNVELVSC